MASPYFFFECSFLKKYRLDKYDSCSQRIQQLIVPMRPHVLLGYSINYNQNESLIHQKVAKMVFDSID